MHEQPPRVLTHLSPRDIIGSDLLYDFKKHYEICRSGTSGGDFPDRRLNKEISAAVREQIADAYRDLRKNGFYPDGFLSNGKIRWRTALQDRIYSKIEKDLPVNQTSEEREAMIAEARVKFKDIGIPAHGLQEAA